MNDKVTKIDISNNPKAQEALKLFMAEKEARRLDMQKKAEEYADKLKKPDVV